MLFSNGFPSTQLVCWHTLKHFKQSNCCNRCHGCVRQCRQYCLIKGGLARVWGKQQPLPRVKFSVFFHSKITGKSQTRSAYGAGLYWRCRRGDCQWGPWRKIMMISPSMEDTSVLDAKKYGPHFARSFITGDTNRAEAQLAKTKKAPGNSEISSAPIWPRASRRNGRFSSQVTNVNVLGSIGIFL